MAKYWKIPPKNRNVTLIFFKLSNFFDVPKVLNVYMNEIYKKITTIKLNKLKFKKISKKWHFHCQELIFYCLKKKSF